MVRADDRPLRSAPFALVAGGALLVVALGVAYALVQVRPARALPEGPVETLVDWHISGAQVLVEGALVAFAALVHRGVRHLHPALTAAMVAAALAPLAALVLVDHGPYISAQRALEILVGATALVAVVALAALAPGWRARGLTPARLGVILGALGVLAGVARDLFAAPAWMAAPISSLVLVAALGALGEPPPGARVRSAPLVALTFFMVTLYLPLAGWRPLGLVSLAAAVTVLVLTLSRAPRTAPPPQRLATVLAVWLFGEAALARLLLTLVAIDTHHLRDTLAEVAVDHAEWLAIVAAALAAWLGTRAPRPGQQRYTRAALFVGMAGAQLFLAAQLRLGLAGNPRAYLYYLEEFRSGHIAVAIGAIVWLAGLVAVIATTRPAPPPPPVVTEVFA